ncbi:hypothetical protein D3C86_1377900 [compost metagenome]
MLQLGQQNGQLPPADGRQIGWPLLDLHHLGPGGAQGGQSPLELGPRLSGIGGQQEAHDADPGAAQAVRVQRRAIVGLARVRLKRGGVGGIAARDDGQDDGGVLDRRGDGAGGVLRMADRDDVGAADQTHGRLEPDHAVDCGGTGDRPVRLGAYGDGRQADGHGRRAARRRPARRPFGGVGVAGLTSDRAPAADGVRRADIGPLRQIGLAEDDRSGVAQPRHEGRITTRRIGGQGQRTRRRRHVAGLDIVFQQDGKAVQITLALAFRPADVRRQHHQGIGSDALARPLIDPQRPSWVARSVDGHVVDDLRRRGRYVSDSRDSRIILDPSARRQRQGADGGGDQSAFSGARAPMVRSRKSR